ncbi:MAG: hypothetical protein MHM6MM_004169 [Cercozoa sp. M6MM]
MEQHEDTPHASAAGQGCRSDGAQKPEHSRNGDSEPHDTVHSRLLLMARLVQMRCAVRQLMELADYVRQEEKEALTPKSPGVVILPMHSPVTDTELDDSAHNELESMSTLELSPEPKPRRARVRRRRSSFYSDSEDEEYEPQKKRRRKTPQKINPRYLYCSECDMHFRNMQGRNAHVKKHRKRVDPALKAVLESPEMSEMVKHSIDVDALQASMLSRDNIDTDSTTWSAVDVEKTVAAQPRLPL